MAEYVYVLDHLHVLPDGGEDWKRLGIYANREEAEAAIAFYKKLPGFREHPEGFHVDRWELGKSFWREGFCSYPPSDAYKEDLMESCRDLLSEAIELAHKANNLQGDCSYQTEREFPCEYEKEPQINTRPYPTSYGSEYQMLKNWGDQYQAVRGDVSSIVESILDSQEDYNVSYEVRNEPIKESEGAGKEAPTLILKIQKK